MTAQASFFEPAVDAAPAPVSLRPYQVAACDSIDEKLRTDRSTLAVMATGTGKTAVACEVIKRRQPQRVLFVAHRDALIRQAVAAITRNTGLRVGVEKAEEAASYRDQVVVGSVQSLKEDRLQRFFKRDDFGLVVVDECFPAGTLVDGRPIETLRVGDEVMSFADLSHTFIRRPVRRVFVSRPAMMVRVTTRRGTIACTSGHPFWTKRGWIPAALLTGDDMVYCTDDKQIRNATVYGVPGGRSSVGSNWVGSGEARSRLLLERASGLVGPGPVVEADGRDQSAVRVRANEGPQSDARSCERREDADLTAGDGLGSVGARRERNRPDGAAATPGLGARMADGDRDPNAAPGRRVSDLLQGGRRERGPQDRDRSGRQLAPPILSSRAGREEGHAASWVGVDGVEVLEPGSDGTFGGVCPDGLVYNLEVADTHTYVAGGFVVHNCHHAVAESYLRVLTYFSTAKVLGLTATPDRGDRLALGQAFESVAYLYEIEQGIKDGYLCRIRRDGVIIDAVELDGVNLVGGDFNQGQLDDKMGTPEVCLAVARETVDRAGDRRTLVFTTGIETAKLLAEAFNGIRPDSARAIHSQMSTDDVRATCAAHKAGEYQTLVNVGIATEGYDDPPISCVVIARPTKSRALYAQMAGRGTRTATGKDDLLIIDITGKPGRHALVSALDVLAGKYPDDVIAKAREMSERDPGRDVQELLELAQTATDEEMRANAARVKVKSRSRSVDPFAIMGIEDPGPNFGGQFGSKPIQDWQRKALERQKVPVPDGCSYAYAQRIVAGMADRRERGLCTLRQASFLGKRGFDTSTLTFGQAGALMGWYTQHQFRGNPPRDVVAQIMSRTPGEEG